MNIPDPDLQVEFALALADGRTRYLQDVLRATVSTLVVSEIDRELAELVSAHSLALLAGRGLRGEMLFPVPAVMQANPRLLGYYRLLYGYSQKQFYGSEMALGRFRGMESRGVIATKVSGEIKDLCQAWCLTGSTFLSAIDQTAIDAAFFDDLTLLTLGAQLRGAVNVRKGAAGIRTVFNAIHDIVASAATEVSDSRIYIRNAAGRIVSIEFAPDPDIVIKVEMESGRFRELIAIEVKAGSDFSNIHNRIGEAEKSHQKARAAGFVECWTVVNVDRIDMSVARRESPSTNRFYLVSDLVAAAGGSYDDFRDRIMSLTGIASN